LAARWSTTRLSAGAAATASSANPTSRIIVRWKGF
jgi:hypothetical protein